MTVATQHLAALNDITRAALLGNAYTTVCYRLGPEDAQLLAPSFDRAQETFNPYTLQHLGRGEAIVRIGGDDAYLAQIPAPVRGLGNIEAIKKQSRLHYARPRADVERKIFKALGHEA